VGCIAAVLGDILGIIIYGQHNPIQQTISQLTEGKYAFIQDIGLVLIWFSGLGYRLMLYETKRGRKPTRKKRNLKQNKMKKDRNNSIVGSETKDEPNANVGTTQQRKNKNTIVKVVGILIAVALLVAILIFTTTDAWITYKLWP